ncbi:AAA family ATPase [Peptacetobacter sp.]|uniref:AAA family ATPase n=1 Tax=Peptacetobacter sp. TaxID=2991975 RepID=UPI002629AB2D|nr:AAA family ATPase [Peptacetobacter sp.]
MKNITIYFGPKDECQKIFPDEYTSLTELVQHHDSYQKTFRFTQDDRPIKSIEKQYFENVVAFSEQYAGITEGAVQSFLTILEFYEIDNLYLQNPPEQIKKQLQEAFPNIVNEKQYCYKNFTKEMFFKFYQGFNENIIGQQDVKNQLLYSLYNLIDSKKKKPMVLMLYGKSGVGKTETAKYISEIYGQKLFRKQLSMFQSSEFQEYLFGGSHSQSSFAKDLLERESNVILLDEFDKPHPVFHSAFYQLFDEGVYEDKNYKVPLYNSLIICTSNYNSENEIRKHLGDPIFYRFDKIIRYGDLSVESIEKIIDKQLEEKYQKLSKKEKSIVQKEYIREKIKSVSSQLNNARQISKIIEEYFSIQLVNDLIEKEMEKN